MLSIVLSAMFYGHSFSLMVGREGPGGCLGMVSCPSTSDLFSPALGWHPAQGWVGVAIVFAALFYKIFHSSQSKRKGAAE